MLGECGPRDIEGSSELTGIVVAGTLEVTRLDSEFKNLLLSLCQFLDPLGLRD
jgi:hypothetical protein